MQKTFFKVAIVAAHFVPSNLAAVHRSRLWSLHLREFGWEPIIVAAAPEFYEEALEPELVELLPKDLKVIRTRALKTKPLRLIGDIGIRGFYWHYRILVQMARNKEIDFLHITIPSNYSALLGRLVHRATGLPYGIDYIDPWVHEFPGSNRLFSKAWFSSQLAKLLEPWAVKHAAVITGINRAYYQEMLNRNPHVANQAVLAEMPYGGSEKDHECAIRLARPAHLFSGHEHKFNLIYAGAMLPKAYVVLERLFEALVLVRRRHPQLNKKFHLHFVGTGKSPNDPQGYNIRPLIERFGLSDCVSEYPKRLPYLDVLTHLQASSGILVLGSTEPHYSPSKVFQSIMAKHPVLALLHEQSTAVPVLEKSMGGNVIGLTADALPDPAKLATCLDGFIFHNKYSEKSVQWRELNQYSARESARCLAAALTKSISGKQSSVWKE